MAHILSKTKARIRKCFSPGPDWDLEEDGAICSIEADDLLEVLERARRNPNGPEAKQLMKAEGWLVKSKCSRGSTPCSSNPSARSSPDRTNFFPAQSATTVANEKPSNPGASPFSPRRKKSGFLRGRRWGSNPDLQIDAANVTCKQNGEVGKTGDWLQNCKHAREPLATVREFTNHAECGLDKEAEGCQSSLPVASGAACDCNSHLKGGMGERCSNRSSFSDASWRTDSRLPTPDSTPGTSDSDSQGRSAMETSVCNFSERPRSSQDSEDDEAQRQASEPASDSCQKPGEGVWGYAVAGTSLLTNSFLGLGSMLGGWSSQDQSIEDMQTQKMAVSSPR